MRQGLNIIPTLYAEQTWEPERLGGEALRELLGPDPRGSLKSLALSSGSLYQCRVGRLPGEKLSFYALKISISFDVF